MHTTQPDEGSDHAGTLEQIERLHRPTSAGDARVEQIWTMILSTFKRWCVEMGSKLRDRLPGAQVAP